MRWAIQAPRVGDHRRAGGLDVLAVGVRRDQDADAAVARAGLEHELVEDVQRLLELVGLREVVGRDGAQHRLLADVEADHVLDVGVGELVVGDARAVLVDQAERAALDGLDQQAADVGVEPVGVGAAVDDVDPARLAQAARRAATARRRAPRARRRSTSGMPSWRESQACSQ